MMMVRPGSAVFDPSHGPPSTSASAAAAAAAAAAAHEQVAR